MSNIYLKVTIKTFSKLRFSGFKKFVTRSVFGGAPTHADIIEFLKFLLLLRNQRSGRKTVSDFYYFNLKRNYHVLKSNNPCILLNQNINFHKNEMESKMENPMDSFRETNLVLQLI